MATSTSWSTTSPPARQFRYAVVSTTDHESTAGSMSRHPFRSAHDSTQDLTDVPLTEANIRACASFPCKPRTIPRMSAAGDAHLGEWNHVVERSVDDDDRHRAPTAVRQQVDAGHGSDGGDPIAQRTPERGREHASVGPSRYEDAPVDAQLGLDAIQELHRESDIVGERWIVDRLDVEVGGVVPSTLDPRGKTAMKPSAAARSASPEQLAWALLESVKPWKLKTTGIAAPRSVSGTTMSCVRLIPSYRNDTVRDPGDARSLHPALSAQGPIAAGVNVRRVGSGVDVAGSAWIDDPTISARRAARAGDRDREQDGDAIPTGSLHQQSVGSEVAASYGASTPR